ncbi:hypothetical protein HZC09_03035 [Candidatus Micrarchaeota archaeon]|nr:hypothetical protein [Candidatus Micrarchaeota archaeon]
MERRITLEIGAGDYPIFFRKAEPMGDWDENVLKKRKFKTVVPEREKHIVVEKLLGKLKKIREGIKQLVPEKERKQIKLVRADVTEPEFFNRVKPGTVDEVVINNVFNDSNTENELDETTKGNREKIMEAAYKVLKEGGTLTVAATTTTHYFSHEKVIELAERIGGLQKESLHLEEFTKKFCAAKTREEQEEAAKDLEPIREHFGRSPLTGGYDLIMAPESYDLGENTPYILKFKKVK